MYNKTVNRHKKCSLYHSLTYDNSYLYYLVVFIENQWILSSFRGWQNIPGLRYLVFNNF